MWAALFCAIAISGAGYVGLLRSRAMPAVTTIAAIGAAACACALLFPVVFSSDAYAYAAYGFMALHGIDPYVSARVVLRDPLLDAALWQWGNPLPVCVYGPAFVWLAQAVVATLGFLGTAASLWALRIIACAALIACAPLAYGAFARYPERHRRLAAIAITLNPIAIWASAEGHNDALVLAAVLGGFALAARRRFFFGAFVVALAATVKVPALAAAAAFSTYCLRDSAQRRAVLAGTIAGATVFGAIALPLQYGAGTHVAHGGTYFPQCSLQALLIAFFPVDVALALVAACCALALALGMRLLYDRRAEGAVYLVCAFWLAVPNPYPWYAIWLLPAAVLARTPLQRWAMLFLSLVTVFRYYADATGALPLWSGATIGALQSAPALAVLIAGCTYLWHPARRETHTPVPDFAPLRLR